MRFDKIVRDSIPNIIRAKGERATTHIANGDERKTKLQEKLQEEVKEYLESGRLEELADIIEVIHGICAMHAISIEDIEALRKYKAEVRGGFNQAVVLEETT